MSVPDTVLIGRITKLLALATSSNEHEAALARERAEALIAAHNLDPATFVAGRVAMRGVDFGDEGDENLWSFALFDAIAGVLRCRCVRILGDGARGGLLFGREVDALRAIDLHARCRDAIQRGEERGWRNRSSPFSFAFLMNPTGERPQYRKNFRLGAAAMVAHRLIEMYGPPDQGEADTEMEAQTGESAGKATMPSPDDASAYRDGAACGHLIPLRDVLPTVEAMQTLPQGGTR